MFVESDTIGARLRKSDSGDLFVSSEGDSINDIPSPIVDEAMEIIRILNTLTPILNIPIQRYRLLWRRKQMVATGWRKINWSHSCHR